LFFRSMFSPRAAGSSEVKQYTRGKRVLVGRFFLPSDVVEKEKRREVVGGVKAGF